MIMLIIIAMIIPIIVYFKYRLLSADFLFAPEFPNTSEITLAAYARCLLKKS